MSPIQHQRKRSICTLCLFVDLISPFHMNLESDLSYVWSCSSSSGQMEYSWASEWWKLGQVTKTGAELVISLNNCKLATVEPATAATGASTMALVSDGTNESGTSCSSSCQRLETCLVGGRLSSLRHCIRLAWAHLDNCQYFHSNRYKKRVKYAANWLVRSSRV